MLANTATAPARVRAEPAVVEATVNYLGPMTEKPWSDVVDRARTNIMIEPTPVRIRNAWPIADTLSLDREGFVLAQHRTAVTDFRDLGSVTRLYPREMEALIQRLTGAKRVIAKEMPVLRFSADASTIQPALLAHSDFTYTSLRRQLLDQGHDLDAPEFRHYSGLRVYQTWRALSGPGQDTTLALTDIRSVPDSDGVTADYVGYQPRGDAAGDADDADKGMFEFCLYRPSAKHLWYYFPDLGRDDLLVWKGFDREDDTRRALHTAFRDPSRPDAPPRDSVEARIYAFF